MDIPEILSNASLEFVPLLIAFCIFEADLEISLTTTLDSILKYVSTYKNVSLSALG